MMKAWGKVTHAVIGFCLLASGALAESGGTITGTIDGVPVTWQLRASQSDWTDYTVSMMGSHPESAAKVGSIMIGFQKDGNRFQRPDLRLLGAEATHAGGEDEGVSVRIERWETEGETLHLIGAVGGPVYFVTNLVGRKLDTTRGHELDLTFDVTITNP